MADLLAQQHGVDDAAQQANAAAGYLNAGADDATDNGDTGRPAQKRKLADPDDDDDDEKGGRERRKIDIKFIQDKSRRHITFSKRKAGIMKKVCCRVHSSPSSAEHAMLLPDMHDCQSMTSC